MTISNIVSIYEQASKRDRLDGLRWYNTARKQARALSAKHGVPLRIVVGVLAALSPNNKWARNVKDADTLIGAFLNGEQEETVKVATYSAMRAKAWRVLSEKPRTHAGVMQILNGQKIVSFFSNIVGLDNITVDGHARNIYYHEKINLTDNRTSIGKKEYAKIQAAYVKAAYKLNVKPYELQAITWVVWRRLHNIK